MGSGDCRQSIEDSRLASEDSNQGAVDSLVTAETCRQSPKDWKMGSADCAQSLVSKNQTPEGSAAIRDRI